MKSLPTLPSGLKELYCQETQITSLPELPASLKRLDAWAIPLKVLPPLPRGLKYLYCSDTQITSLPELPPGLVELNCYNTQITVLPELPLSLEVLYTAKTPLLIQRKSQENITQYRKRWCEWREEQASKKRMQEKNKLLKEEIMMEVWKPDRIEKWLLAGYDPDD